MYWESSLNHINLHTNRTGIICVYCVFLVVKKKEKEMQKYANQRIQIYTAILELYFDFGRYSWIFAAILSAMLFNDLSIIAHLISISFLLSIQFMYSAAIICLSSNIRLCSFRCCYSAATLYPFWRASVSGDGSRNVSNTHVCVEQILIGL